MTPDKTTRAAGAASPAMKERLIKKIGRAIQKLNSIGMPVWRSLSVNIGQTKYNIEYPKYHIPIFYIVQCQLQHLLIDKAGQSQKMCSKVAFACKQLLPY